MNSNRYRQVVEEKVIPDMRKRSRTSKVVIKFFKDSHIKSAGWAWESVGYHKGPLTRAGLQRKQRSLKP